ncbi:MAG: hypothetical protein IRY99_03195 [Isosphaeraceae bacterium]|nr:hypothetical protein [Isosphaeraceae bacterium]
MRLDREFLAGLVEQLPPCPLQAPGRYRGRAHSFRLLGIDPKTRRFLVAYQVEGEFRPPIASPLSGLVRPSGPSATEPEEVRWRHFRFDIRIGINIEARAEGTPRFQVEVEEVRRRELEGIAGALAKVMGRYFDDLVTRVVAGKANLLSERFNAEILKRVAAFRQYGVFCGIDYAPTQVVLRFDLTRFQAEGVAGHVFAEPRPGTVPWFRWLDRRSGAHFYTASPIELDRRFFASEGVACYVYDQPAPETVPLYYWRGRRDHLYTTDPNGEGAMRLGLRPGGIAGYVYRDPRPGTIPLYRFFDPRQGLHFYTTHPHAEFAK